MGLTFDQLLDPPTKEDVRGSLLLALQGVGYISHSGHSPGTIVASGVPLGTYSLRVKVVTAGSLGVAQVQLSTDGGVSYGSTTTVPSNGVVAVTGTGITLTFSNGPTGSGDAFRLADVFSAELAVSSLPVTSWQAGSVPLTLTELVAEALEDLYLIQKRIAAGGFLTRAEGDWLDLLVQNLYNLSRNAGVTARHLVTFSCAAGAGPYGITPGQLWVATAGGLRFNSEGSFTIPSGSTVQATVRAERPGSAYNVANNTITQMVTALAGVSVNNPNPGSGTSISVQGADEESDELLRDRARKRWPSLGTGATAETYDLWARTISAEVTRTKVRSSPSVEGQVEIYLAGSSGPVSAGAVTDVTNYIAPRLPLGITALIQSAGATPYTVTATVYVRAGYEAQAQLESAANVERMNRETAIGGTVYLSNIIEELSLPAGVRNVVLSSPLADVVLGTTHVGTPTLNLTFTSVP